VMACKGGCLGGGGEPKSDRPNILEERAKAIYSLDAAAPKRMSHENTEVQALYDKVRLQSHSARHCPDPPRDLLHMPLPLLQWLGKPLGEISERELHTTYSARGSARELLAQFLDAVDCRDGKTAARLFAADGVWRIGASFGASAPLLAT
jgi:NADP-reducing hydrogenase subunit HndD